MGELVSIITPVYNCAKFIAETINSVIAQTYINWELIIVDDCSTDDTENVVRSFQDQRNVFIIIRMWKIVVRQYQEIGLCVRLKGDGSLF